MFATWAERYLEYSSAVKGRRPPRWLRQIVDHHLIPALGRLALSDSAALAEAYKRAAFARRLSPKTINNHLSVARAILRFASERGALDPSPRVTSVAVAAPMLRFLTAKESDLLLHAAEADYRGMILLALRSGLRLGELRSLRWVDLDATTASLVVAGRRVPLCPRTLATLAAAPRRSEWIFASRSGARLSHGACKRPLARAAQRAGLAPLGWADLRHTFTRELLARRVPVPVAQALLGLRTPGPVLRCAPTSGEHPGRLPWSIRDRAACGRWRRARASLGSRSAALLVLVSDESRYRAELGLPHFGVLGVPMLSRVASLQTAH